MLSLFPKNPSSPLYFLQRLLAIAFVVMSFACLDLRAQATIAQSQPYRYEVETNETATFYVGKEGKFDIELLHQDGKRADAPSDLETTIIVTSLESLDDAKNWLNYHKTILSPQKVSGTPRIVLARGQEAAWTKMTFRKGEKDESVRLLSYQPGALHIFVESENITTGESFVVVLKAKRPARAASQFSEQPFSESEMRMVPIQFQAGQPNQLKLDFRPSKPTIYTNQGDQIGRFQVVLQSANNEFEEAPRDIRVIIEVEQGYANFSRDQLLIPAGQVVSPEQAELRTRAGGSITVKASTSRSYNITPVSRTYEFKPGVHSTSLSVTPQRESAYANGLDEIELRVAALQDTRAITPEEEGMEERRIFFHFVGDSQGVRFENGKGEITIPKGQTTGTIKLSSARSVSNLKIAATSRNGLRDEIKSPEAVPIVFTFPWLPMVCALLGGLAFPLLTRRDVPGFLQGLAGGMIIFVFALFGAMRADPQLIGAISVNLAKMPTENALASFVLGFAGSVLLEGIFVVKRRVSEKTA